MHRINQLNDVAMHWRSIRLKAILSALAIGIFSTTTVAATLFATKAAIAASSSTLCHSGCTTSFHEGPFYAGDLAGLPLPPGVTTALEAHAQAGAATALGSASLLWNWVETDGTFYLTIDGSASGAGMQLPCPAPCSGGPTSAGALGRSNFATSLSPAGTPYYRYSITVSSSQTNLTDIGLITYPHLICRNEISSAANSNSCDFHEEGIYDARSVSGVRLAEFESLASGGPVAGMTWQGQDYSVGTFSMSMSLTPMAAVPLPAAAWLFGSGLGLMGVVRRKQTA